MKNQKIERKKSDLDCKHFGFVFFICLFICVQTIHLFDYNLQGHFLAIVHAVPTVVLQIGKADKQKQINRLQCDERNLWLTSTGKRF